MSEGGPNVNDVFRFLRSINYKYPLKSASPEVNKLKIQPEGE